MQAESELRANKQVIRDHQLAKCREALLPMAMLDPGLVLQSVPKGHSASAKVTHLTAWHLLSSQDTRSAQTYCMFGLMYD